jgi:NB-ARC domain
MATGGPGVYELVAPAQLPSAVDGFVGRETEIREIRDSLIPPGQREIINLTGIVGVGKSALAINVCQTLRAWFPDGQLYAELSDDGRRVDPREVLTGFLLAFGVHAPAHDRPLAELSAMWRSVAADRKIVILLDDAHDSAQVMPLLPGSRGCGVLITSWRRLVDVPGLRPVSVTGLRPPEALRLLSGLAGERRVAEEPDACARLVARCSHHPLPIRIAAARLLGSPYLSVDQVDARVQDDLRQLYAVDEDCEVVDRRYGLALDQLNPELARAAMLFAMADGRSLDLPAAASLLGLPKMQARRVLEALGNAHLLEIDSKGNHRQSAIVCALMRRYALRRQGVNECKAALDRLSAHLDTVA